MFGTQRKGPCRVAAGASWERGSALEVQASLALESAGPVLARNLTYESVIVGSWVHTKAGEVRAWMIEHVCGVDALE